MSKQPFKMPDVQVGMPVQWFPYGDGNAAFPAFVVKVSSQTVTLAALAPDSYNLLPKDGVRHLRDPEAKRAELMEQGAWDFAPWFRAVLDSCGDGLPHAPAVVEKK